MYWNDEKLTIEPYERKTKHYYCGKELLKFATGKTRIYTILVIDLDECCCADVYSDGEIKILFQGHSEVPHKHKKGGQSAQRFARIRDNEITLWYKKIDEYMKNINTEMYVGISDIYKNRFIKTLSTYSQQKIKEFRKTEYTNLSGIYQFITKLEREKGNKTI